MSCQLRECSQHMQHGICPRIVLQRIDPAPQAPLTLIRKPCCRSRMPFGLGLGTARSVHACTGCPPGNQKLRTKVSLAHVLAAKLLVQQLLLSWG